MPEHTGQSLVGMLWEALDAQYNKLKELHDETGGYSADRIMSILEDGMSKDSAEESSAEVVYYLQTQGKVAGLAFAVGTIVHPYKTARERIDLIRAELPARWAKTYGEE
jgi:hypothetical protein